MPRGRKKGNPETLEQQIKKLDEEIASYERKLGKAKEKRKALTEQKKKQDIESLYSAIRTSGKSVEEVLQLLKAQQAPEEKAPETNS